MYAPHASPARDRPAALASADLAAPDDVGLLIPAVGVIGAIAALCVAYQLLRNVPMSALAGLVPAMVRPRRHAATSPPRRTARGSSAWFGLAVGLTGLTALVPLAGTEFGARPMALSAVVTVAAVADGAAFLPALLLMIPAATSLAALLRWAVDGAIVCLCLTFCGWAVASDHARVGAPVLAIITFHCWVLATAALAGACGARRGAILCAAGVWTTTFALAALAVALGYGLPTEWLLVACAVLVAAPVLVWLGTTALRRPQSHQYVRVSRTLVVAVAATVALFAVLHQLLHGAQIDWVAWAIGGAAVLGLGIRQLVWPSAGDATSPAATRPAAPATVAAPLEFAKESVPAQILGRTDPQTGVVTRHHLSLAITGLRYASPGSGSLIAIGIGGLDEARGAGGEQVLREVIRRLRLTGHAQERRGGGDPDAVARLSVGRFAVLTRADPLRAYGLASRMLTTLSEPVRVPGQTVRLSACAGLTHVAGAPSTEDTVRRAEVALRRAEQLGDGQIEWYDAAVEEATQRHETIKRELPDAMRRGELDLVYQPIMDLVRNRPTAVEALLRWRHPKLGTLLPEDVIPAAEVTGLIGEVGTWVLGRAAAQLSVWRRQRHDLSMAINISPREFDTAGFTARLDHVLAEHDLPPDRLVFEVAESAIHDGDRIAERLGTLRSIGVRTALDAFGAGPESLSHLRQVPIDIVKIGQPFFGGVETPAVPSLVEVIVGVGRRLGVDVVAHGLEVPEHLEAVRTAGCRLGQGHLFARPQPAERTEAYLAGFPTRP